MPTPPVFFVSYSRADTRYPAHADKMRAFIEELSQRVAEKLALDPEGVCFFDESDIEAGTVWTVQLAEALRTCQVGVAVYSNYYFNSSWCGREFQVLMNRMPVRPPQNAVASGIVPILWVKRPIRMPDPVGEIQYKDASFPREYDELGIRQLLTLRATYTVQYEQALESIAERIVRTANESPLAALASLDLENTSSAWETAARANQQSHAQGGITKTCFVYVSRDGWGWQPYPETSRPIGALAQQLSGELAVQYEQLAVDSQLGAKLMETRDHKVPTVIIADPTSLQDETFAAPLRQYDGLYLRNCGALVPWSADSKSKGNNDVNWRYLRERVCQQKTVDPLPPNHEWRSIFSQEDLLTKARVVIEDLRARLRNDILTDAPAPGEQAQVGAGGGPQVLRAENPGTVDAAARAGINIGSAPQVEAPSR